VLPGQADKLTAADHRARVKWYADLDRSGGKRSSHREAVERAAEAADQEVVDLEWALEDGDDG
jgi:hypothetical protein